MTGPRVAITFCTQCGWMLRAAWMARAARLGQTITARTGPHARTGRFDGIDEAGALILTTAQGREVVPAADIYFAEGA